MPDVAAEDITDGDTYLIEVVMSLCIFLYSINHTAPCEGTCFCGATVSAVRLMVCTPHLWSAGACAERHAL